MNGPVSFDATTTRKFNQIFPFRMVINSSGNEPGLWFRFPQWIHLLWYYLLIRSAPELIGDRIKISIIVIFPFSKNDNCVHQNDFESKIYNEPILNVITQSFMHKLLSIVKIVNNGNHGEKKKKKQIQIAKINTNDIFIYTTKPAYHIW